VLAGANALPRVTLELPTAGAVAPRPLVPFYPESFRTAREVTLHGPARVRMTYLGYGVLASERLWQRVRRELAARGLDGIIGEPRITRRLGLLHVAEVEGTALRHRAGR